MDKKAYKISDKKAKAQDALMWYKNIWKYKELDEKQVYDSF